MAWTFNPFTGRLDYAGSGGGGGAQYIDGEVQFYADLPIGIGVPPLDSAYIVREASGTWLINRHPAGIYIRLSNTGALTDWTYAGTFPDVFSDANFTLYNSVDATKNLQFDLSVISNTTTRTLTIPDKDGTIELSQEIRSDFVTDTAYIGLAPLGSAESDPVWTIYRLVVDSGGNVTTTTSTNVSWDDRLTETYS